MYCRSYDLVVSYCSSLHFIHFIVSAVDGIIAGQLVKLEEKFPVIGDQPGEVCHHVCVLLMYKRNP